MNPFEKFENGFKNPDRRYAIYPIIHDNLGDETDFEFYRRCGFAGVVGNVRYTKMQFPNADSDWQRVSAGFRGIARHGMTSWIYDEEGYPSGSAGGYVTETYPEYIAQGLYCYDYWKVVDGPRIYRADVPGDQLWKALLLPVGGGDPIDVTHYLNQNNVLYIEVPEGNYHLFMMSIRRLFDGTHATESYSEPRNYISLSDVEATKAFIEVTHENYKKYLGDEFGKSILATFTDEPSLISWNIRAGVFPILPWHKKYPEEFKAKYGYDFHLACVAVVLRMGLDQVKRRCDFWEYIADTVADGFFATIQAWCHNNNLKSSGHMLEEEVLQAHVYNYGSFFRSMKKMDWPGIDQLETVPAYLMDDRKIPIARFIASFADLNGEHETFTEFSDHEVRMRGEFAPIEYYYQSVNWHHAMGINNFTSYYSWNRITDEQKLALNQYTSRAGFLLRKGVRDSKVAVFYPEAAMWDAYKPSTAVRAVDRSDRMMSLQNSFTKASWDLLHRQIDFDYIDREILVGADIKNGKLCFRDREYAAVVITCARVLEDRAFERLIQLAECGITVFCSHELPAISRETGAVSPCADRLKELAAAGKGVYFADDYREFGELLDRNLPAACRFVMAENPNSMLLSHVRITEEGERIVFIANMAEDTFCGRVSFPGIYEAVCLANCHNGDISAMEADCCENTTALMLTLRSGEGKFILLK